ncbi:MAG: hypothetical protein HQM10_26780 [Candidatus Riflebacteria bacterium]|nr:hypothetical protein [Candidatus Riflebacteria bacterium]
MKATPTYIIEDALIDKIRTIAEFKYVGSVGRDDRPAQMNYPAALVLFTGDSDSGNKPRAVRNIAFTVAVLAKNLVGRKEALRDVYQIIDAVRDLIHGSNLDISDLGKFSCDRRAFGGYSNGIVTYILEFSVKTYLPL